MAGRFGEHEIASSLRHPLTKMRQEDLGSCIDFRLLRHVNAIDPDSRFFEVVRDCQVPSSYPAGLKIR